MKTISRFAIRTAGMEVVAEPHVGRHESSRFQLVRLIWCMDSRNQERPMLLSKELCKFFNLVKLPSGAVDIALYFPDIRSGQVIVKVHGMGGIFEPFLVFCNPLAN